MFGSSGENIRYNGTGRMYVNDVGEAGPGLEVGELDGVSDSFTSSDDKIKSNRTAAKVTLMVVKNETEGSITFGVRERTMENLELAYSADAANTTSQLSGYLLGQELAVESKKFSDLGKTDCFTVKIGHGTVTGGPYDFGESVTDGTATGTVAWVDTDFVELVNVAGTFSSGGTLTGSTSGATATISSVETLKDLVVVDHPTVPTVRYEQGVDYSVDADYGYVMKQPDGSLGASCFVSCSHKAISIKTINAMSAGDVEKKITIVTDADDLGPRERYTYWRVKLNLNGESQKIGDGEAVLPMTGTILADPSKPSGEQFLKIEQLSEA